MKFILPITALSLVFFALACIFSPNIYAQTSGINAVEAQNLDNQWIIDPEVTSIGKNASRSGLLLDWALKDYDWSYVVPGSTNPLINFWITIRNFVYAFMFSLIVIAAIVMVVTRGRSLTARRFLPRLILIAFLVTFSFALIQAIYEITDIFQGFFVRPGGVPISQKDLLYISWNYEPFVGLRLLGDQNYESAFTTLAFVKLTTFTYYVMVGILLIRKIILWFFIIISPVFPILLMFYPLRNTAKIWIGEFFRWLLYAPLFAIFLAGLVSLWKIGIPLHFNFGSVNTPGGVVFPTAVSILLGGPGQSVTQLNNLNVIDTYAQYMVALLMLWAVIIVPWILLQIFLDYFSNMSFENTPVARQLARYVNRLPVSMRSGPVSPIPPPSEGGSGLARSLPVFKDFKIPSVADITRPVTASNAMSVSQMTRISVPTMRDIARYDIERISNSERVSTEATRMTESLRSIANPSTVYSREDAKEYEKERDVLRTQSQNGNLAATNILNVAKRYGDSTQDNRVTNISTVINELENPQAVTDRTEREKITSLKESITTQASGGNLLAKSIATMISQSDRTTSLTKVLQELSSEKVSDALVSTKEILTQKNSAGDPLAAKIMTQVEKIREFEKVKESLVGIYNPQVTKEKVKEKITKLHESIIKEVSRNNVFAQSVSANLERLSKEKSIIKQQQIISEIKEEALKEDKIGNILASELLQAVEGLRSLAQVSEITILQKELEDAEKQGNPLAASLLKAAGKTNLSNDEIKEIDERLEEAKAQGDPLAILFSDLIARKQEAFVQEKAGDALPKENRIQKVSLDDYESVKKMWTESYKNLEVPGVETEAARENWIKEDIHDITETIDLLSSQDQEKVKEGMDRVSGILPFLLVGGFSQDEITAYMKAKLEAAKAVLVEVGEAQASEDTKIEVKQTAAQPKTLYAEKAVSSDQGSSNAVRAEESRQPISTGSIPIGSKQNILQSLSIEIPDLKDLARYDSVISARRTMPELMSLQGKMHALKNPTNVQPSQRNYFAYMKNAAVRESEAGDPMAKALLKSIEYEAGNEAESALSATLPEKNDLQQLSLEDYEAIKRQWLDYYEKLDVPVGKSGSRTRDEWIKDDVSELSKTIMLLTSKDSANINEGISRISDLMPFILLGGFSKTELVAYLKAKLEAGNEALKNLKGQGLIEKLPHNADSAVKIHVLEKEITES